MILSDQPADYTLSTRNRECDGRPLQWRGVTPARARHQSLVRAVAIVDLTPFCENLVSVVEGNEIVFIKAVVA